MSRRLVLVTLTSWLCAACASTPARFAGRYNHADHIYSNNAAGFRLLLPQTWTVRTMPQDFTVPVQLRPDQEQVLEAYDPTSKLGLVIVVQQGPLAEIADLVQKMQTASEERLANRLQRSDTTDFRQLSIRTMLLNGRDTAEWIYTVTDTTGGQPTDMTVSYYIVKVGENYVYLTFSIPAAQYTAARPAIETILHTFATPPRLSS